MTNRFAAIAALAALPWLVNSASGEVARSKAPTAAAARPEICEDVKALATGFGKEHVISFANGNLDLVIDDAKNRLADKGAKGFVLRKRNVACEYYIDFGGPIGKEHKCTASAQLCGKG